MKIIRVNAGDVIYPLKEKGPRIYYGNGFYFSVPRGGILECVKYPGSKISLVIVNRDGFKNRKFAWLFYDMHEYDEDY